MSKYPHTPNQTPLYKSRVYLQYLILKIHSPFSYFMKLMTG